MSYIEFTQRVENFKNSEGYEYADHLIEVCAILDVKKAAMFMADIKSAMHKLVKSNPLQLRKVAKEELGAGFPAFEDFVNKGWLTSESADITQILTKEYDVEVFNIIAQNQTSTLKLSEDVAICLSKCVIIFVLNKEWLSLILKEMQILAFIDHRDGKNVIFPISKGLKSVSLSEVEHFRTRKVCDHCQTERKRNKTYLVKFNNGEIKQIGSTCLEQDYQMTANLKAVDQVESLLKMISEFGVKVKVENEIGLERGEFGTPVERIEKVLPKIHEYAKSLKGKYPKNLESFEKRAIADEIHSYVALVKKEEEFSEAQVQEVLKAANNLSESVFKGNLIALFENKFVAVKDTFMLLWLLCHIESEKNKVLKSYKPIEAKPKDRIVLTVKLVGAKEFYSEIPRFGVVLSYLYEFLTEDGSEVKWKSSNKIDFPEDFFKLKGTVKDFGWKDERGNLRDGHVANLTRCVLM